MKRYVALLRGINVGGNNLIKMPALRQSFEKLGLAEVQTYIQSGNVVFCAARAKQSELELAIEKALSKEFKYTSRVVVISHETLKRIVAEAPKDFGKEPAKYRYDVIFLKTPLTPRKAMAAVETRDGVDKAHQGKHALYFSRLIAKATQSRLSKIVAKPEYQFMTIRNWNTTTKLLAMTGPIAATKRGDD